MDEHTKHPDTLSAQGGGHAAPPHYDIAPGIFPSTTYERAADGGFPGGRVYSRDHNPTYETAEQVLAALESAHAARLFASGMAAATSVFLALAPGDRVLAPRAMYWSLRKWLLEYATAWGLRVELYENSSIDDLAQKTRAAKTRLIWIESPANPTWDVTDIAAAAELAREAGATLAVDSTVPTPVLSQPLTLGAHLVMHSATKYLNGHSDVVAGALATAEDDALWQRIGMIRAGNGAVLGPFEAWLLARGMRTLHVRVRAACANAHAIAARFATHPCVAEVLYPGLSSHPGHGTARRQMHGGFGAMLSLRIKGGEAAAMRFAAQLRNFRRATSLGSTESLAEHRASVEGPGTQCPADLVRLSVGIEHVDDLMNDIEQALHCAEIE
jgi:cystathionine gamma-synthase